MSGGLCSVVFGSKNGKKGRYMISCQVVALYMALDYILVFNAYLVTSSMRVVQTDLVVLARSA